MDFKKIEINDKTVINDYLINNQYGICDYSFANIFIWQQTYKTCYCIADGFLIIRSYLSDGKPAFLMPLGNGDLKSVINSLIDHSKNKGEPFRMAALTEEMAAQLCQFMPENFVISQVDGSCDYLYLSENLIKLTGKKYNGKRNHINKFMSLYGDAYEYVEINADTIEECKEMNRKWCKERDCDKPKTDFEAVLIALENFEALRLIGAAIRVKGEMVAFTLGQPNNKEVFDVIVEKALMHIEGAYPMINKEFALRNCKDYTYINREEDMGVEGLRKAKLSYNPYKIVKKNLGVLL